MAYFPNGTSGEWYQNEYCSRCLHDENHDCAVWLAHLVTDYHDKNGEISEVGKVLNFLIHSDGNIGYEQCKMFVRKP